MGISRIGSLKKTGVPSYHRRSFNQDYYAPFIYHIILKKAKGCEIFGAIKGDARIAPSIPVPLDRSSCLQMNSLAALLSSK